MTDRYLQSLARELDDLDAASLRRVLHTARPRGRLIDVEGTALINLSGNDYLGLADHPAVKQGAMRAVEQYGAGAGASRLVSGTLAIHAELEARFAQFKHADTALLCPTGYMANLAVLTALAREGDLLCLDKLCHASLIDAARASDAGMRTFAHRDVVRLRKLLARHQAEAPDAHRFVVTDSIFSMDGDAADLPALCDAADDFDAAVIVDEAHGTGVLGDTGAGLCELQGVTDRVDVVISTASKALGSLGGIVTAPQVVIDTLINRARAFIYTTAVPPAQAGAILAALDVVRDEPERRERLHAMSAQVRGVLPNASSGDCEPLTPIVPVLAGSAENAIALAGFLRERGFFAPAIRPPTVPPNTSRVRLTLRADLTNADVERLCDAIAEWLDA